MKIKTSNKSRIIILLSIAIIAMLFIVVLQKHTLEGINDKKSEVKNGIIASIDPYKEKISQGFPTTDVVITDDYFVEKFRDNASRVLPQNKINEAAEAILKMETVYDISEVMKLVRV